MLGRLTVIKAIIINTQERHTVTVLLCACPTITVCWKSLYFLRYSNYFRLRKTSEHQRHTVLTVSEYVDEILTLWQLVHIDADCSGVHTGDLDDPG